MALSPDRSQLPAVLEAVTGCDAAWWRGNVSAVISELGVTPHLTIANSSNSLPLVPWLPCCAGCGGSLRASGALECRCVECDCTEWHPLQPDEAWESLLARGLVTDEGAGARGYLRTPLTMTEIVALASCWPSILQAERLAQEIGRKIGHEAPVQRFVWRVCSAKQYFAETEETSERWAKTHHQHLSPAEDVIGAGISMTRGSLEWWLDYHEHPGALQVTTYEALPALVALTKTGCALTDLQSGTAKLVCPLVEP